MTRTLATLLLALTAALAPAALRAGPPPDPAAALLRLDDLPPGWRNTFDGSVAGPGVIVDECGDGAPIVPAGFAVARFQRGEAGPSVEQSVALFASGDATRALRYLVAGYTACGVTRDAGPFVSPLPFPALGDERVALRLVVPAQFGTGEFHLVVVRRGDALFLLTQVADLADGGADPALTERLARLADARLADLVGAGG